ncbi:MCE family protein [Kitasatospora sp. MAP5-34]|uniref:MCE family protein n=1 Tax=Kitasatospora sp. MAP5-34 TaxID=3035102 RepID=UPI002475E2FE|nr:MCE family protein [Kitasatospora sp. MAP5-34]MDH6577243.1 phospholipid/cholesterol/gamma-HCH transport system substrate-binding protein [Kitasatospora sp. MAP5-34]
MRRPTVAAALLAVLSLAGCSASFHGIQGLTLPGGADLGAHPYRITANFADVLSLVPQAAVKVNDVAVGRVTAISLGADGWSAVVTMKVNGDVRLPANAYAHLEQSSLLGEKYVQLSAPPAEQNPEGRLADGAAIPVSRTSRNPEVEEVFGALSMLLNGGGVSQLRTITVELDKALTGNEPQIRSMLTQVNTLVSDLDAHKQDITDALDGVDRLSATLANRDQQIGTVLTDLSPGLKVLDQQRGSLVTMLRALDGLSGVAVDTVNRSKADLVADLQGLAPTLRQLADAGKALPDSLQVLLTYPFTDEVLRGVKGDYLNVYLNLTAAPGTQIIPALQPQDNAPPPPPSPAPQQLPMPQLPMPLPPVTPPAGGGR